MSRISLLALAFLLCLIVVHAEESKEHQLSERNMNLSNLKRVVRSPEANPKKKSKKKEKKVKRKNKKGQNSKGRKVKKSSKRPRQNSGSKDKRKKKTNVNKRIKKKSKSKRRKTGNKIRNKPRKVKVIKKTRKTRKNKPKKCNRQGGVDDSTCSANIELAMDYEGIQIKNFKNQKKRLEDFDKLVNKKGNKKDNFKNTTSYLKEALGTNNSCSGTTNQIDAQTAISTHSTLSNCSTSVESGCTIPADTYDSTVLASCENSFKAVSSKNAECYTLTTGTSPDLSAACTCWKEAATLVTTTKALSCSALSSLNKVKALKKTCLSKFSDCKKAEDASVGLIQVCNGRTTPSTASVPVPAPAPAPAASPATAAAAPTPAAAAPTPAAATTAAAAPTPTAAAETTAAGAPAATAAAAPTTTTAAGCKCGVKKTRRIVGGTETEINEYPWMAALANNAESFFCGGTLIASQWILTASHCLFDSNQNPQTAAELKIVLGEHDITTSTESTIPRKVVSVSQIFTHPSYAASTSNNDIALLKLSEEVDLDVYTPACLPKTTDSFNGQKAWVYGWGTTSFGGSTSDKLLEVQVPVVSNSVCDSAMSSTITDAMLCAGGELNKDGCQGDSGGPLTIEVSGQHVLIGDVSFGNGCGLQGQYGVYGDVAFFRTSFIDKTMDDNGGSKKCPA